MNASARHFRDRGRDGADLPRKIWARTFHRKCDDCRKWSSVKGLAPIPPGDEERQIAPPETGVLR